MTAPYLVAKNLIDPRIKKTLTQPISFVLKKSESLVLKGKNGAGKTTLLRILCNILKPMEGEVFLNQNLSFVPHKTPLYPTLKVNDYLKDYNHPFIATLSEKKTELIGNLSSGQQRTIFLFLGMDFEKKIWIFDEPTVFLDSNQKKIFANIIQQHLEAGGGAIWSSHNLDDTATQEILL